MGDCWEKYQRFVCVFLVLLISRREGKQRKQNIENFVDDIEDYKKVNQATLYTLLASEEAEKYIDYILQGLLEVKSPTLKKMVKSDEKTPTLIESKDGEIEIYGINHTKIEVV